MPGLFLYELDKPVSARYLRFNMKDKFPVDGFTWTRIQIKFADIGVGNLAGAHQIQSEVKWNAVILGTSHDVIRNLDGCDRAMDATGPSSTASGFVHTFLGTTHRSM